MGVRRRSLFRALLSCSAAVVAFVRVAAVGCIFGADEETGGGTTNVMQLARGVIVADLTITNGYNVGYSAVYASGIRAGATDRTEYIIVTNCIVTGCRNGSSGAAIYLRQSKHKVFDTVFRNNTSTAAYGSLKCIDNSTNLVVNCRFENNTARQGGGVYAQNATLACKGCVFVGNTVTECGGGACVAANPLFANVADGDFSLRSRSPCRNGGENEAWMMAATDLAGNPRVSEDTVDIGCSEWLPIPGLRLLFR